jgi:hypothetical protein
MAGEPTSSPVTAQQAEISYCPELGLYHFIQADGQEFFFTNDKLVEDIDVCQKAGDQRRADFMSVLTGLARKAPHKVLRFDEHGNVNVSDLVPLATFDDGGSDPQAA